MVMSFAPYARSPAGTYYSLEMKAVRPRSARRRPGHGLAEQQVNGRLVRAALLVLVVPAALLLFTVARPGALPAPVLPPAFDGPTAVALASELARDYPNRTPGSSGAVGAARWLEDKLALYGLSTRVDTWRSDVPGLGTAELRNLVTVVPGEVEGVVLVVAHRDNSGSDPGANDNASGTAALVELARGYGGALTGGPRARPNHTLVFLSSDAGSYGGLGVTRFVQQSPLRGQILSVVSLDAIAGGRTPRLAIDGEGGRSPAAPLIHTAALRLREQTGEEPELPGVLHQLVDLGIPFAFGEQAPFLGSGISALRLTTTDDAVEEGGDRVEEIAPVRYERLGRAAQALLGSLDAGAELTRGTTTQLVFGERVVRGWALALLLAAAVVPPLAGIADLIARLWRRGVALAPAFRSLRSRLAVWLWLGALVWAGALLGFLPADGALPPPAPDAAAAGWEPAGVAALAALGAGAWALARLRLVPHGPVAAADELAGLAVGLVAVGAVAVVLAVFQPFALVFVLPSLYAWLWLARTWPPWVRDVLFGIGLAGPALAIVSLAERFALGPAIVPYGVGLVSSGGVPTVAVVSGLAWCAAAAQVGAVTAGRYAPYADGALRPPPGVIRGSVRRVALVGQTRRR